MQDIYYPEKFDIMTGKRKSVIRKAPDEGNFINVYDFMITELGLSSSEHLLYALIYAYTKEGLTFYATKEYIANRLGVSVRSVYRKLEGLIEKELIVAHPQSTQPGCAVYYEVNREKLRGIRGLENVFDFTIEPIKKCYGYYRNVELTLHEYVLLFKRMKKYMPSYIKRLDIALEVSPELKRKNPNHYALLVKYFEEDQKRQEIEGPGDASFK